MHLAAAVQLNSGPDKTKNLDVATSLVREASHRGAALVGLPENFAWMGPERDRPAAAEPLSGPIVSRLAELARGLKITLIAGSVLEPDVGQHKLFNTSVVLGPDGAIVATYRKMHLFDVEVGDGASYRESDAVTAGDRLVVCESSVGRLGLSICYDLRFPELYRECARLGAEVLSVPAAFTLMTGKDHWEVLLRARAIENQCHVLAPAQWGHHGEKRVTYGNAMVVDPWGCVVARASDGPGLAVGPIDPALTARLRKAMPCLAHRRL